MADVSPPCDELASNPGCTQSLARGQVGLASALYSSSHVKVMDKSNHDLVSVGVYMKIKQVLHRFAYSVGQKSCSFSKLTISCKGGLKKKKANFGSH